ncbi:hypothetical protein ACLOJK_013416 [Asimina triloba]
MVTFWPNSSRKFFAIKATVSYSQSAKPKLAQLTFNYSDLKLFITIKSNRLATNMFQISMKMGSSFNKAIFNDHAREGLVRWAQKVKKRKGPGTKVANTRSGSGHVGSSDGSSLGIQLQNVGQRQSTIEEGTAHPSAASKSA